MQLPSPAPKNSTHEFTVVRVTKDRVIAIPYNYREKKWSTSPGKMLDKNGW